MSISPLSFALTNTKREELLARNLAPYSISGIWSSTISNYNTEINFSNYNVIDSPNTYISRTPFLNTNTRYNTYSPDNGFTYEITYNDTTPIAKPNEGQYNPNPRDNTYLSYETNIDAAFIQNIYGPEGGYDILVTIDDLQLNNKIHLPYWNPPVFTPSSYSAYQLYINPNAQGTNGPISDDSKLAQIGATQLRDLFQARVDTELLKLSVNRVNLQGIVNPFFAALDVFGNQPAVSQNFSITVPEGPIGKVAGFIARASGVYTPTSPIPGDYFNESLFGDKVGSKTTRTLGTINRLLGGSIGPVMNLFRNPSESFLAYTGNGQKSVLFQSLNVNKYKPNYDAGFGGLRGILQTTIDLVKGGSYNNYLGSRVSDNSQITSPPNEVPINASGQQVQAPVYGPDQLGILFEGNEGRLNFGLAGKTLADGGTVDGGFVWVSPKYKDNAGFRATPGGGVGNIDDDYNLIKSYYELNQSTNLTFKIDSILDNTQRLVNSGDKVTGKNRLKHVGNAINQVSKVFNDGYKEITKGSKVISYVDNNTNNEIITQGREVGVEYCRLFTKDTPYYTYGDLQKTDGITKFGRKFNYSVLDNTFNLNISPTRLPNSTNIKQNNEGKFVAKKYMLSIENLAWRTSSQPGLTYDDLPLCERGPNGGRVMWFPPYDLKFNDSSNASFQGTSFLGRPEPMYTYKETTRSGSLSFKMIVDHPSVLNTIIRKQLKGQTKERVESIVNSFFAGCTKYDIYELAKKFNTIPLNDLVRYQLAIENPKTSREGNVELAKSIPRNSTNGDGGGSGNGGGGGTTPNEQQTVETLKEFNELRLYFEHAVPGSVTPYDTLYNSFTTPTNKALYNTIANDVFNPSIPYCQASTTIEKIPRPLFCEINRQVTTFFNVEVEKNYNELKKFVEEAFKILNAGGTISMSVVGSASAPDSSTNNKALSDRRNQSLIAYLKKQEKDGKKMSDYIDKTKTFKIAPTEARGEDAEISLPPDPAGKIEKVFCTTDFTEGVPNRGRYSVQAMACRRVTLKDIKATIPNNQNTTSNPKSDGSTNEKNTKDNPNDYFNKIPLQPRTVINPTQITEGISKKILRNLFSECDYFDVLKEEEPMIYDSIRDKIKFFNPAFHSMTPEGLNSRLVFLNQCVRPGQTIPTIGADGRPKFDDALNTSFGTPPVLVLRIGDFYHTKIIPDSVSFTYEPLVLDMNPEGIGLQPMIANVTLSFKIIGGMGLAKPVEQLQNALSFSYYANTEIYDERATPTDDSYIAIDKEFLDLLNNPELSTNTNDIQYNVTTNTSLIGEIVSTTEMSYKKIMDQLLDGTSNYFKAVISQLESLNDSQNYGWVQLLNNKRDFTNGSIKTQPFDDDSLLEIQIYGKPDYQSTLDLIFNRVKNEIDSNANPIIKELLKKFKNPNVFPIIDLKNALKSFIDVKRNEILNSINSVVNTLSDVQQNYIQIIRKLNVVVDKTDGIIDATGNPIIYNVFDGDYDTLISDYFKLKPTIEKYNNFLLENKIAFGDQKNYELLTNIGSDVDSDFFLIMSRVLTNKENKNKFIEYMFRNPNLVAETNPVNLKNKFEDIIDKLGEDYKKELDKEKNVFKKIKQSRQYTSLTEGIGNEMYPKGKTRNLMYNTTVNESTINEQKELILNLYRTTNVDNDRTSFNGKIKFN